MIKDVQYTFLRHADPQPGPVDLKRGLTLIGLLQAQEHALGNGPYDLVLSSPALRCIKTGGIASNNSMVEIIEELGLPTNPADKKVVSDDYARLGKAEAPLSEYLKGATADVYIKYGQAAQLAIEKRITRTKAKRPLFVGHAIMMNAVGYVMCPNDLCLSTFPKVCTGFTIYNGVVAPV